VPRDGKLEARLRGVNITPGYYKAPQLTADAFDDVDDIPKKTIDSLCRFLVEYSVEAGNKITFDGVRSRKKALALIAETMKAYRERNGA